MSVKVRVRKDKDGAEPDEYVFDHLPITIGRDSSADLTLPDYKRIVSKHHAEIRQGGRGYQLVDLGSKNFTYLRGDRLSAEQPVPIEDGDTFRIGDFELVLETVTERRPEMDRTVFAQDFINPFLEHVGRLASSLEAIRETYDEMPSSRREEALDDALREMKDAAAPHEALATIAHRILPADAGRKQPAAPEPAPKKAEQAPTPEPPPSTPEPAQPPAVEGTVPATRLDRVLDALLTSVAKVVGIPWRFRHEFIGQTIVQSEESAFLYDGDADKLRAHLLHPNVDERQLEERLELLREAVSALVVHQLAMLDGYKASVQKGAERLLAELDPRPIEAALEEESTVYRLLPILAKVQAAQQLEAKCAEIESEDWSVAERRTFRPAFIKAYLARMTSSRRSPNDTDGM